MAHSSDLIAEDIDSYLLAHQHKSLLRFITCGSVDDGKSTLIGRILFESHLVFSDHLDALETDSKKSGTQGDQLDLALLVDGLTAEREQGITIDVAYRFFSTDKRKFIVADTPGHEQYTRNMVTGASTADLAVILVDARKGVLTQTRRHSYLVSLVGIDKVVLAVNKLDLVDYDQQVYDDIVTHYTAFANQLGLTDVTAIPMSALRGDNITGPSTNTPWYAGPSLFEHLESVDVSSTEQHQPFRMPVQWVNRPDLDFRGFSGLVVGGTVRPGDAVRVLPTGTRSTVERIVTRDGDLDEAVAGQSVTITLTDQVDASRGDVLCADDAPALVADRFKAHLVWMAEQPLRPGLGYLLKLGSRTVAATVGPPEHRVDVNTLVRSSADSLALNEIGVCTVALDRPITLDPYSVNRDTGGFILIDRLTGATVAAGMVDQTVQTGADVRWHGLDVDRSAQAQLKGHQSAALWFTGLSGSGKSTVANLVQKQLHALGVHTALLDGDNVRHGLNTDLGFSDSDRVENVRRVAEVARLMVDAGLVVLVSFISPFRAERDLARGRIGPDHFVEVHVDTPLAVAEARDPKGLYAKARRGELPNFTGIDSAYEAPLDPEVRLNTSQLSADQAALLLVRTLRERGVIR